MQQDVENDQLLGYSDLITLGTVNFNRIIDGIRNGDVLELDRGLAHSTSTAGSTVTIKLIFIYIM